MCGRFLLRTPPHATAQPPWDACWRDISVFVPRFNICPTERSPLIFRRDGRLTCQALQWGIKLAWFRHKPIINVRAERVLESSMFCESARYRRCLVVADGFYEPKGASGTPKRPWYLFEYADGRGFAFAGIWMDAGFSLVTCEANQVVRPIHNRMPLVLDPSVWRDWLDDTLDDTAVASMLEPGEYPDMLCRPVGDFVKNPGNEGPQCIAPAASA